MSETPLALRQLVMITISDLQLGPAEKTKLEVALYRAFALGMSHAESIMEKAFDERSKPEPNAERS